MHAWLWQKNSLETAAALEVEGRQTLCFLFTTEAQCWKISKIGSLAHQRKWFRFFQILYSFSCSKQLILVLIFGGKIQTLKISKSRNIVKVGIEP